MERYVAKLATKLKRRGHYVDLHYKTNDKDHRKQEIPEYCKESDEANTERYKHINKKHGFFNGRINKDDIFWDFAPCYLVELY